MEAKAVAKYVRISPKKVRQVIDIVRNRPINEALLILRYLPKKAAKIVEKVLRSAIANAENNFNMNVDKLYIYRIFVDQGPTLKRIRPRAMGRAYLIRKRTSHITVVVKEKEG